MVKQHIREGKKVVIVAHSQGSLYANSIYEHLDSSQKGSVSLVFVAPSASYMSDASSNYISNPYDILVQEWIQISQTFYGFEQPLSTNVAGRYFADDLTNHHLIGYLNVYENQFMDRVISAFNRISIPEASESAGPITVELTWDEQPDIDLHVF